MDSRTIGERLRTARTAAGFTQEQVARFLDVKRETISYVETGARPATTLMLRRLAGLYGYRFSYFVDEAADRTPRVAMAFRVPDLGTADMPILAQAKRIASNLDSLYELLGE